MKKTDMIERLDTVAAKKAACKYRIQPTCASCVNCLHYYAQCKHNGFPVNLDRGICDDFKSIERTAQRPSLPGGTRSVASARRKTITRRTKR